MKFVEGLENIVAVQTKKSSISGSTLKYCGYDIKDLAENSTFEEIVCLLLDEKLPSRKRLQQVTRSLKSARSIPPILTKFLRSIPNSANKMLTLSSAISLLGSLDSKSSDFSPENEERIALQIIGSFPTIVASLVGKPHLIKSKSLTSMNYSSYLLYMMTGKKPSEEEAHMFDQWLILHADHTLNASTFTARTIASTLADTYSAVAGGICALKGPLHGGANQKVMQMLLSIKSIENIPAYISKALSKKERIMGFGHRVYKKGDPRATILAEMSSRIGELNHKLKWYFMSESMTTIMKEKKALLPNVDFFSASFLYVLGIPIPSFPLLFATARSAGWTSHIIEQHANNRLIRPESEYIGPQSRKYLPLKRRS